MGCKWLYLAACVALAASRAVEDLPILNQESRTVLYKLNQPLRLDCPVVSGSLTAAKFSWTKNGQPVTLDDNVTTPEHLKDSLVFLKTTAESEGVYQCFVTSDAGVASSGPISVRRTFIEVPKVTPKKLKPVQGQPFQLECPEVKAYPKPKIVWMYQHGIDESISHTILDQRITTGPNGFLYFSNITDEDLNKNFKYVCTAKNSAVDDPVSLAEYILEDAEKKDNGGYVKRTPQYYSTDMTVKEGDVTALYCIYGGTPLVPPDWYFNGKLIEGGPNDRVTDHNRSKGKRLLIRDTRISDQGEYSCKIADKDGLVHTSVMKVTVVSTPKFVAKPEPKTVVKAGNDVTIRCQLTGIPDPDVTWTYNAKSLPENTRVTPASITKAISEKGVTTFIANLVIKKVVEADKGYYGCKGVNDNGDIYAETLLAFR